MEYKKREQKSKPVYNRKIARSMLKHHMGTNKIRNSWHQLRGDKIHE